ncbi:hypothetical protein OG883_24705 [Streptomyces sp. NBC_01142]|uniref:hypothetical protein n=1 Tax=Streptomyces sp. NBC_01142 TaxID=2975865 RepID=UPI00224E57B9|nr:hypothetical protein [Streptomyces sp. NBC_01142]MCX4823032.1 hypothetical protein [Streptomyces sp. NBC_01142]
MRRGRIIAAGAVAAVAAGLLVIPAMGNEAPGSDPTTMTATATGAEQPEADFADADAPVPAFTTKAWGGPGTATPSSAFALKAGGSLTGRVKKLDGALPKQGIQKVLKDANRTIRTGASCTTDPFGKGDKGTPLAPARKYCWEKDDATSAEWVPQAITGVSDAQKDEQWGSRRPVLIGSYDSQNPGRGNGCKANESDKCNEKGVRITFLDPGTNKYRHALLVWPYVSKKTKKISYDAVHANEKKHQTGVHIGGMAWYGNYLYIADTFNGIRVFDMRKIMDLNPDNKVGTHDKVAGGMKVNVKNKKKIGRHGKSWYSFGYRYVMPQVATWTFKSKQYNKARTKGGKAITYCAGSGAPKASYLSVDRSASPDELVMGEYCRGTKTHPSTGRLSAYPLDGDTGRIVSGGGVTKTSPWGFFLPKEGMQGAARFKDTFYLNQSHKYSNGTLLRAKIYPRRGLTVEAHAPTAVGPEDLYVEHGQQTGNAPLLWSVSEHRSNTPDASCKAGDSSPCGRVIYAHRVSDILARP